MRPKAINCRRNGRKKSRNQGLGHKPTAVLLTAYLGTMGEIKGKEGQSVVGAVPVQWAKETKETRQADGPAQSRRNGRKKPRKQGGWGGRRTAQRSLGAMGERNQGDARWVIVLIPLGDGPTCVLLRNNKQSRRGRLCCSVFPKQRAQWAKARARATAGGGRAMDAC